MSEMLAAEISKLNILVQCLYAHVMADLKHDQALQMAENILAKMQDDFRLYGPSPSTEAAQDEQRRIAELVRHRSDLLLADAVQQAQGLRG